MKHAGVDLLFFFDVRVSESLQCVNQLLNPLFNVFLVCLEHPLELIIRCIVNFFGVLVLCEETREKLTELYNYLSDLIPRFLLDQRIGLILRV